MQASLYPARKIKDATNRKQQKRLSTIICSLFRFLSSGKRGVETWRSYRPFWLTDLRQDFYIHFVPHAVLVCFLRHRVDTQRSPRSPRHRIKILQQKNLCIAKGVCFVVATNRLSYELPLNRVVWEGFAVVWVVCLTTAREFGSWCGVGLVCSFFRIPKPERAPRGTFSCVVGEVLRYL